MPEPVNTQATRYRHCHNCGDLLPDNALRCPHCGASNAPGNAVVDAGILLVKIVVAVGIGLFVLPLGACGACSLAVGMLSIFSGGAGNASLLPFALLGAALLALSFGGVWIIIRMFAPRRKGANRR